MSIMNSSELLSRSLSVRLNTRQYSRLGREEVVKTIDEMIDLSLVKVIQIMESTCFITLKTQDAKESLIINVLTFAIHTITFLMLTKLSRTLQ